MFLMSRLPGVSRLDFFIRVLLVAAVLTLTHSRFQVVVALVHLVVTQLTWLLNMLMLSVLLKINHAT
jgi:hypothetical protein